MSLPDEKPPRINRARRRAGIASQIARLKVPECRSFILIPIVVEARLFSLRGETDFNDRNQAFVRDLPALF